VEFLDPTKFFYVYNYTDHLGNVRMSYTDNRAAVPKILEESHYYPFGLKHENYASERFERVKETNGELFVIQPTEKREWQYKYNGKEWQDELGLNFYDYGARNYDAAIGRWMNVDPLAEKMRRWSPYNYCFNNPTRFVDPDGMGPKWIVGTDGKPVTKDSNSPTGYSTNMSKSALDMATAMNKTEQGRTDFENMMTSTDKAYDIKVNSTNPNAGEFGKINVLKMEDGTPLFRITVNAATIAKLVTKVKTEGGSMGPKECDPDNPMGPTSKEQASMMTEISNSMPTRDAVLAIGAAVVSHEKGHEENGSAGDKQSNCNSENLPEIKETTVLRQTLELKKP
jgi:RHS repeat-associated protein